MTTVKTITLTIWTFVGQVMSLLFNTMSSFVKGDVEPDLVGCCFDFSLKQDGEPL